ncbi:MAG: DUF4145 domain-containing protein [Anaerolineae bacterium]|jgi:hypothetical protein|nr:DUF4145 domain-containing protein [Anaerolineae bacterium]MBT7191754.1 DUF4145 domain-containing protein [Anaerolineae bacterium]MBT7989130.1 DUF4145 domain-containing protein [Anaerolineae bacterium]
MNSSENVLTGQWSSKQSLPKKLFTCGHCGHKSGSEHGYLLHAKGKSHIKIAFIYICGGCNQPSYFGDGQQVPAPILGNRVDGLPEELNNLYSEARQCTSIGAYTACVLACRKMLMHIAVDRGATEGENFWAYVQYLNDNNYIPPNGGGWVDYIREKGNEANHEIVVMEEMDAFRLLSFVEMLLKFIYEFPSMLPSNNSESEEIEAGE